VYLRLARSPASLVDIYKQGKEQLMIHNTVPRLNFYNSTQNRSNLIKLSYYKRVGFVILTGCLLSPTITQAQGHNSETRILRQQMEEYKQQLEITNKRLQELEERETVRNDSHSNGNGLSNGNGNGHNGNGSIATDTATAIVVFVEQQY